MTREEAYNKIDAVFAKHEIDDEYVTITNSKDYDALRMARKLLEQEPRFIVKSDGTIELINNCYDCIIRKPVVTIDEHIVEITNREKEIYNKGWEDGAKATAHHLELCKEENEV